MKSLAAVLIALVAVLVGTACQPIVEGDSLVFNAVYPVNNITGATVFANIGHDACQDQQQIISESNSKKPDRLVLAYTGTYGSSFILPAWNWLGVWGVGQRYADCYRAIRARIPAATQLIIVKPLACLGQERDPHGNPVVAEYMRVAVLGGRYPSGTVVGALPNSRWSTAVDERMTPGHVFRWGDAGGVMRTSDGLHLTLYGGRVYGQVLSDVAAGRR